MCTTDIDVLETREVGGVEHRVYLEQDTDAESPRAVDCSAGVMVTRSVPHYEWPVEDGDTITGGAVRPVEDGDTITGGAVRQAMDNRPFQAVARWLRMFYGATVVLPLYSTGQEGRPSAGDETDTPGAGDYLGVTFDQPSTREVTGVAPEHMAAALSGDVDEYSTWAVGEVFGYIIERRITETPHPDCAFPHADVVWEEVESCWGLIGDDYARTEALRVLSDLS